MLRKNVFAVTAVASLIAAPAAFADTNIDTDPYWTRAPAESATPTDRRAEGAAAAREATRPDIADPGRYNY